MSRATFGMMITAALMSTAGKLITALGIGAVTYTGLDIMQRQFTSYALSQWQNLPVDGLQIIMIAGIGVALNWVFGAIAFIVAYKSVSKIGLLMKGKQ